MLGHRGAIARPGPLRAHRRPLRLALGAVAALAALASLALFALPARAASLEGVLSPGEVIQGHAKNEDDCNSCHTPFKKGGQDERCIACHKEVGRDIAQKSGYHGRIRDRAACRACHTDHKGRLASVVVLEERKFDHALTNYELQDAHQKVECAKCHRPRAKYRDAAKLCVDCHKKDDDDPKRKGHRGALGARCEECHTAKKWTDAFFDHDKTRFALRNAHGDVKVACADCHANNRFKNTPVDCYACHRKDDDDPRKKGHRGKYGDKCGTCHTDRKWATLKFDHDRDTRYPLRHAHAGPKVACKDCHVTEWVYRDKLRSDCVACHRKDDKHQGSEGDRCEKCHAERDWKTTHDFDHDKTRFPLRDAHADAKVRCEDCHKTKVYTEVGKTCYACHQKDDDDPKKKGHHGRYGQKCETCHGVRDWKPLKFDHDRDTKYLLLGKHRTTRCDDCHAGKDLYHDRTPTDCDACHRKDDKHQGKEGPRCEDCHFEQDWKITKDKFDHGLTAFPLLGKHARVECKKCHVTLEFRDAKTACVACHEKDDQHKGRLGSVCEDCHNAVSWKRWDFDHDARTRFKLDGKHAKIDCYACHKSPVKGRALLPMACAACHANDDVHNGSYGRQCERCHLTTEWRNVKTAAGDAALAPAMPALWRATRRTRDRSAADAPLGGI
jgi:hypothetical protein